jgi:hypothetical protein
MKRRVDEIERMHSAEGDKWQRIAEENGSALHDLKAEMSRIMHENETFK